MCFSVDNDTTDVLHGLVKTLCLWCEIDQISSGILRFRVDRSQSLMELLGDSVASLVIPTAVRNRNVIGPLLPL